jgi:bifunctional UDP-N-acetylglucosamine pyrophosphorylase/glucosamine-1-phosphate N-acetyltransferase
VERIVEHRDATKAQRRIKEINAGLYLVDVPFSFQALGKMKNANAQGEYYLTDLVEVARAKGKRVRAVERSGASDLLGINDRNQLALANKEMNRRLCGATMRRGVTLVDPASTWVGPRVKIGKDTLVQPGCFLQGDVRIGARCRIGPGVVITDSVIRSDVEILAYSVLDHCEVGSFARIGPFSRLRPGARLATKVHVGNFVEVKKSKLGEGSKANHLSYLGDTEIGAGVNVGAGTITCNYDGKNKYQTVIEDGAFIGSDTQLVAPVKVGKGAIVGAGTTVTVDVPPGSLAVSRVRQRNIRGYAKKKRK